MIRETRTESGKTILHVETEEEFYEAFGRALDDPLIDITAPEGMFEKWGVYIADQELGRTAEIDDAD